VSSVNTASITNELRPRQRHSGSPSDLKATNRSHPDLTNRDHSKHVRLHELKAARVNLNFAHHAIPAQCTSCGCCRYTRCRSPLSRATRRQLEMSGLDWARKVFRLRRVPYETCTPAAVQSLLCNILGLPSDHVVVHSVARTTEIFEVPSRTATLQMKSIPACLQHALANNEWALQVTGRSPADVLILDTHFVGMTILYDPPPSRHQADCIAISGLASHPFGSWQPRGQDKTFMWIRDTIPAACPEIRTVIYGYDSKLTTTRSFQSITDISLGLILHLKSGGWNRPSSKPLVFLAHSLGGLVLKEAIVQMAENRDQTVSDVLRNVCGAIMFGVPSLGMEQSHLMAMVEGQPNESLVQDLSRDANYVRQLNARFEGLSFLRTARIFWAYETEESPTVEVGSPKDGWRI